MAELSSWPDLGERWPSRLVATAEEDRLSFRRNFILWFRLSQCHRGVLISHSQYKLGGKALHTIRRTRRCHPPTWRRAQNAVCLNGVGHDGDGHNAASSDVSNHNFRTLMLAGRSSQNENPARVWQSKREVARGSRETLT